MGFSHSLQPSILQIRSAHGLAQVANPFATQLELARQLINPHFPTWALALLISFVVLRGLVIFSCLAIISIPIGKGGANRSSNFYLVRRIGSQKKNSTTYLVPNRSMIIAVTELLSSLIYVISAVINYRFYTEAKMLRSAGYLSVWYGIAWLPSSLGIWCSGWALAHACLCDVQGNKNTRSSRILTPVIYNTLWVSWIIFAIVVTLYWTIRSVFIFDELDYTIRHLKSALGAASNSWDNHHDFSRIHLGSLMMKRDAVLEKMSHLSSNNLGWSRTWMVLAAPLAVFYVFTAQVLLHKLREVLRLRESETWTPNLKCTLAIWQELEEEFRFLSRCTVIIFLTVVSQIGVMVFQSYSSEHLDKLDWRIGSALMTQLPGVIMAPSILFQSWRIFANRNSADESAFHLVPSNEMSEKLPQMASQLLGWNFTVDFDLELKTEVINFPGLAALDLMSSEAIKDDPEQFTRNNSLDICVVRSTVVTQDCTTASIEDVPRWEYGSWESYPPSVTAE